MVHIIAVIIFEFDSQIFMLKFIQIPYLYIPLNRLAMKIIWAKIVRATVLLNPKLIIITRIHFVVQKFWLMNSVQIIINFLIPVTYLWQFIVKSPMNLIQVTHIKQLHTWDIMLKESFNLRLNALNDFFNKRNTSCFWEKYNFNII